MRVMVMAMMDMRQHLRDSLREPAVRVKAVFQMRSIWILHARLERVRKLTIRRSPP
jgi:hypothetical protein